MVTPLYKECIRVISLNIMYNSMDNSLQALRLMQYGQGFGGVLRGMYRQIKAIQNKKVESAPSAPVEELEQIGEGKKKGKRKRVYKAHSEPAKKKAKKANGKKKAKVKKFQVPIPPYNF